MLALYLDYFYGGEAEQYSFYRIPKVFFTDPRYKALSVEAKVLYGLMLDRMGLSLRNDWLDSNNRVFIIFTLDDATKMLNFSHTKIVRLFKELEEIGLIERKKQGQGCPAIVYVKNFVMPEDSDSLPCMEARDDMQEQSLQKRKLRLPKSGSQDFRNLEVKTSQKQKSRLPKSGSADFSNMDGNNTEMKDTDISDTDLSIYPHTLSDPVRSSCNKSGVKMDRMDLCREHIRKNIEYNYLIETHPADEDIIDSYVELMVEACCTSKDYLFIGGEKLPSGMVKDRFLKLTQEHIIYVMDCMKNNTVLISNIKAYTLTALYNAPVTITQYYESLVNHDLANE